MDEELKIIGGKYKIIKGLGKGTFSSVFLVEGPQGQCALKLLKGSIESLKKSALAGFKNEFALLKDIRHPNIASILDFGFDEEIERYYYTSELISGQDFISATKQQNLKTITGLIVQALRALSYLHSYRIYHFDIKSANVLVVEAKKPEVKIIDFGLSGIDPRGRLIGTPAYIAPEIVARDHADGRADLYSLGVLWYAALTHVSPFSGGECNEVLSRQLHLVPPPPSQQVPSLPKWIDAVVMRLLEKNPANRFQNAYAVIREINRLSSSAFELETRETLLSYIPHEGRFVGRAVELGTMEDDIARLKNLAGASSGCFVMGASGSGKTRMMKELKYRSQLRDVHVEWASAPDSQAFSAWCDELTKHISSGKGIAAFILDDAQAAMEDELARTRLISVLLRAKRPEPACSAWIALVTRPLADEHFFATIKGILPLHINVRNFSREELNEYLVALTGLSNPPKILLDGLFDRTEGNPLFVMELLKSLIEGRGLFDEHGRWKETIFEDVGVDFSKAALPRNVGELLLERGSLLTEWEREIIDALSAANRPATALELGEWAGIKEANAAVNTLLKQGILDRAEAFCVRFHNALMGQAVYESMTPSRQSLFHDKIANYLRAAGASREEIFYHQMRGSDAKTALDAAIALGDFALKTGRGEQATDFFTKAIELAPHDDVEQDADLRMKMGEACLISRNYSAATKHFALAEEMIAASAKAPVLAKWRADVLIRLGGTYIKLQEFDRARTALHDAKGALNEAGRDQSKELTIENFLGNICYLEGRLDEAKSIFTKTRAVAEKLSEGAKPVTNNDLGAVLMARGEFDDAGRVLAEDLVRAKKLGDDLLIARAHYTLAQLAQSKGNYDKAVSQYKECVEVCRRSHNTELMLRAYNGLGNACQISGDAAQSIAFYERGLALHEMAGDLRGGATIAINMGIIEHSRGKIEAALDRLIPAVEYLKSLPGKGVGEWAALSRGLLEMGDIARKDGRLDEAREKLEEARAITSRVPQTEKQKFWIMAALAEVAFAQRRTGEFSDLIGMLEGIAISDDEKKTFLELKKRIGETPKSEASPPLPQHNAESEYSPSANRFMRILEINKLIAAQKDLNYVLKTALYYAMDLTGADGGAMLLLGDNGVLTPAEQRNMEGREEDIIFSSTLAKKVIETGFPIRTNDAMLDERFAKEESILAHGLRSILCMPVRSGKRIIGVLYLENKYRASAFATADLVLLDAFADQMGLAIETARLLAASEKKTEALIDELAEASHRVENYEALLGHEPHELKFDYGVIAGKSSAMQRILRTLDKIADTEISVFICGESGTGKELIARALHINHTKRNSKRFIAINCGAIPATLIESELFGYKAGAFTGAVRDKRGLIEEASGGTLFLDEVSELSPEMQVKLLRVLQERECTRIGDTKPFEVDLRVITASNCDIEALVKNGIFREDLYYRICQIKIDVPPLRERPEDLTVLVERFVSEAAQDRKLSVHPQLMRKFLSYKWPGNVRELQNLIQVCCALVEGNVIDERAIPENHPLSREQAAAHKEAATKTKDVKDAVPEKKTTSVAKGSGIKIDDFNEYETSKSWRDYERIIMAKCYEVNGFHARHAAKELGIAVTTLYSRIKEYRLDDHSGESYSDRFKYIRNKKLEEYLPLIFSAALKAAGNKPTAAIANLRISQGYFYKVIKKQQLKN